MRRHRGVASFARSGGGGAKLKSGGQRFSPKCECEITNFPTKSDLQKGLRRNPKAFSGRNHKFSDQKQEKRSSPKFEGFFWPKSQILTFFPPKNTNFFLPKKYHGGQEKKSGGGEAKTKIGGAFPPAPPLEKRLRRQHCVQFHRLEMCISDLPFQGRLRYRSTCKIYLDFINYFAISQVFFFTRLIRTERFI